MRYSDPRLVDHLASAYVLGTLPIRSRRRFERLRQDRADVSLAVAQWEARLGQLAQSVAPLEPAPRVWREIAARTQSGASRAHAAVPRATGWRWGLGGIVAGSGLAVALLMALPTLLFTPDQLAMRAGEKLPQSYVGLLTDAQGNGKVLASSLRHGRVLTVKVIGPLEAPPAGLRRVLWAVPAEGAPFVLGNVPDRGSATAALPDTSEKLLSKVGKLVVAFESAAEPATPGMVELRGNCAKLW